MGDDIDIIPTQPTIPTLRELTGELERVLALAYETTWVRDAFGNVPLGELRVTAKVSELVVGGGDETRPRLTVADPGLSLAFPAGVCVWIAVDENSWFPLYFLPDDDDDERMRTSELVDLIHTDAAARTNPDPSLADFPWGQARAVLWHWGIWTRSSPRGARRVLGKLGALAMGTLVDGLLSSGDTGLPDGLDPTTPTRLLDWFSS